MSRMCSRKRVRFQALFWNAYTRAPSTVRRYASGVCGRTPREIHRRSKRYVSHGTFFRSQALTDPTDVSPGDCGLETLDAPKYRPPSGCHSRSTPADLRSDARWGPDRVHRESPGRGQDKSRECPSCFIVRDAHSLISCLVSQRVSDSCIRVT